MVKPDMASNKNTTSKKRSAVAIAAAAAMTGACLPAQAFADAPQAIEQEAVTEEIEATPLIDTDDKTVNDNDEEVLGALDEGENSDKNENENEDVLESDEGAEGISPFEGTPTLEGPVAFYEANPQNNPEEDAAKVVLEVSGGTFISTIGEDAVITSGKPAFISGGNYSSAGIAEYVVPGKVVIDDGDIADAPFVLDEEQLANDRSAGYVVIGGNRVYYTTPEALSAAAEKLGVEAVASTRTVTFIDRHGNTLKTVTVDYGKGVPTDEIPQLPEEELTYMDAQGRTHEFTGWSVSPTGAFTENTEIAPTYGEKLVYSTITFKNGPTGEVIAEVSAPNAYELSDSLIPNPEPTIEVDGKTYKFTGWDDEPDGFMVDGDKVFTANYELADAGDGSESGDKNPSNPETPEKPGDGEDGDNTSDGENIDDNGNALGSGENVGNGNENIQDDENALCAPDENEKALHQTGDFLPYVIASAIVAAVIGLIALIRRKMSE